MCLVKPEMLASTGQMRKISETRTDGGNSVSDAVLPSTVSSTTVVTAVEAKTACSGPGRKKSERQVTGWYTAKQKGTWKGKQNGWRRWLETEARAREDENRDGWDKGNWGIKQERQRRGDGGRRDEDSLIKRDMMPQTVVEGTRPTFLSSRAR
jgi:hypothetical protein